MILNPVISHFIMPNKHTVIFACKGVLSMAAALFIAMHLELDRPFWAVVASMLLQARPESGLVIEKALYLVAGSVVGGIVAVVILGNFTAYPVIALALLTLWIGLTSYLSAKVQHVNYNYLLGLTGVTAPLIVLLVMSDATTVSSLEVFEVVRARLSEAMVGAFCAAMVSVLFIP
ncbi:FUSC family protein, partial [Klebsiella pneumoniae]|uniref:FUSC family protein n=1 Tax=Klebsiella pneumoniae TaxID=573 RepID=UPI0023B15F2F